MAELKPLFDDILAAINQFGEDAVDEDFEELEERVKENGKDDDPSELVRFMKSLRGIRAFGSMVRTAEVFDHVTNAEFRNFAAQGLIDTGRASVALTKLQNMREAMGSDLSGKPLKETLGLIGRANKQSFVNAIARGRRDTAELKLKASFDSYEVGFDLDPSWAGSNMAALAWRAREEGFDIGADPAAVTTRVLAALPDEHECGLWDLAAHAQARMANDEWNHAADLYERFTGLVKSEYNRQSAFMLFGDRRQLREIWLCNADDADPSRQKPFEHVIRTIAEGAYGRSALNDDELKLLDDAIEDIGDASGLQLQRMIADGRHVDAAYFEKLSKYHPGICRIEQRSDLPNGKGTFVGTGFLVKGGDVHENFDGRVLLATNWHVMSTSATRRGQITPEQAQIEFERCGYTQENPLKVGEIVWTSAENVYDMTFAAVEGATDKVSPLPITANHALPPADADVEDLGFVNPIGHPLGNPMGYSLSGNDVIDHNLSDDYRGPQVVHYAANTERGNSGSPVFDRSANVVAVHHAYTPNRIFRSKRPKPERYKANEGIGIGSILAAVRAEQN